MRYKNYIICSVCSGLNPHYSFGMCRSCYNKTPEVKAKRNLRRQIFRAKNPEKAKAEWDKYNKGRKKPRKNSNEGINEIARGINTSIPRLKQQIEDMEREINGE